MRRWRYHVQLSYPQILALVDLSDGYEGEDSPARRAGTLEALARRELILGTAPDAAVLSGKGEAYLDACAWEAKLHGREYRTGDDDAPKARKKKRGER